jgi:hypothetical protein
MGRCFGSTADAPGATEGITHTRINDETVIYEALWDIEMKKSYCVVYTINSSN